MVAGYRVRLINRSTKEVAHEGIVIMHLNHTIGLMLDDGERIAINLKRCGYTMQGVTARRVAA